MEHEANLKPCSHCGSQPLVNDTLKRATCDADHYGKMCEMSKYWLSFDTWNNRPLEDELVAALEDSLETISRQPLQKEGSPMEYRIHKTMSRTKAALKNATKEGK